MHVERAEAAPETLVLFGISTSGVVLSTILDAFDADYRTIVIGDCCADRDVELHRVLINRFLPNRGEVLTAEEFVACLSPADPQPERTEER